MYYLSIRQNPLAYNPAVMATYVYERTDLNLHYSIGLSVPDSSVAVITYSAPGDVNEAD